MSDEETNKLSAEEWLHQRIDSAVQSSLLSAADEMPVETLASADRANVWLRERAYAADPEGRAHLPAVRDRQANA